MHTIHKDCGGMGGVVHEERGAMIATHRENTREQSHNKEADVLRKPNDIDFYLGEEQR